MSASQTLSFVCIGPTKVYSLDEGKSNIKLICNFNTFNQASYYVALKKIVTLYGNFFLPHMLSVAFQFKKKENVNALNR